MDIYEDKTLIGSVKQYSGVQPQNILTYTVSEKVPDDVRGYLVFNGNWCFYKKNQFVPTKGYKKLALILESPHKDEYRINNVSQRTANGQLIPQRPANGFAGDQIDNYIQNRPWISQLCKSVDYEVFIMNAIQYQCSACDYISNLEKLNRRLTDSIFLTMWNYSNLQIYPFQDDFKKRIQNYAPDVIINACTKGKRKVPLQNIVENFIVNQLSFSPIIDYHPATIGIHIWK